MLHHGLTLIVALLGAPADDAAKCPISGKATSEDVYVWEKVAFCCKNCRAKYAKENKVASEPGKCCVSGKPGKADVFLVDGDKILNFCCNKCQKKVAKAKGLKVDLKLGKAEKCPISGKDADKDVFVLKRTHFCCKNCQKKYAKQNGIEIAVPKPAPKPKAAAAEKTKCPISGKDANPDCFTFEKVAFCCKNCQAKYAKKHGIQLDPGKCPISGKPAKADAFLIHGKKVVNFCCNNCRGKYAKENALAVDLKLGKAEKCPISGKDADQGVFVVKKVDFCCGDCRKKYVEQNGLQIAFKKKVETAKQGDVCPISGKPAKVFTLSEGKKVGFCCENCVKKYGRESENRLTAAQKDSHWDVIFDGKGLSAFQAPTREGKWKAEDGVLIGSGGAGVLATKESYGNFVLTVDARVHDTGDRRGNSGIFFRSTALDAVKGNWPDGLEVQIDHGDKNYWTGSIWKAAKAKKVKTKDKEWFGLKIEAIGPRIRVWVDGELVTDHMQPGAVVESPIAFQVHHATDVVEFKNLKIQPLRDA